jgi:endoglucanase
MQLGQIPRVIAEPDDFGNIIATYRGCADHAEYAFAAHMDHPGYVLKQLTAPADATAEKSTAPSHRASPGSAPFCAEDWEFLGGVPASYREKNPPVRDFGAFAMWDLPACEFKDGRIYSRACDDLIGCAAIVALFQQLERSGAVSTVCGLFTRAEEVGFIGAIHLAKSGRLRKDTTIVSLECSSEKSPGAGRMGEGVIVRVGDKTSVFDDVATAALTHGATEARLPFQRSLMSGGTCEATAYQLYGYRTAALCVALGNYHNCGPDTTIAAEFISLEDLAGMVRLMAHAATHEGPIDPHRALRERFEKQAAGFERHF